VKTSEQINEIAGALAKAQAEIQNVTKDAKNPHFKSDYATLDAITDTVRPVFSKHGLSVVQIPSYADGVTTVETLVTHISGQWIGGATSAPTPKADPQGVGSACTYLRRYSLAAIACLAQTDDDGNAATGNGAQQQKAVAPKMPEGFGEWWADMTAVADEGADALKAAWQKSKPEYRAYVAASHKDKWEAVKAKASKVREAVTA
jgi:hypothetical protein